MTVFFDIDCTLADARWRLMEPEPVREQPPESRARYDAWLARCLAADKLVRDPAVPAMRRLAFILMQHGSTDVYFLTARNENMRTVTTQWLRQHDLFRGNARLIMNPIDNPLPVWEYKVQAIEQVARLKKPEMVLMVDDSGDARLHAGCAARGWTYLQVRDQAAVRQPENKE
jgi:FMN phosphatase YigB (HAD superfamily)